MNEITDTSEQRPPASPMWGRVALVLVAAVAAGAIVATSLPEDTSIASAPGAAAIEAPDARVDRAPAVEARGTPPLLATPGAEDSGVPGHETRAMKEPPAGLPVYEGATLLMGVERKIPNWVEQQVVYRIDDASLDPHELADWYTRAAERDGWTHKRTATATALNRVFVDGRRSMTITVRQTEHDARVTFLYREALAGARE